jgi:hypothetical protein
MLWQGFIFVDVLAAIKRTSFLCPTQMAKRDFLNVEYIDRSVIPNNKIPSLMRKI